MSTRHRNHALFAGPLLLLAAASAAGAGEGWNCVTGQNGIGWTCTGQGNTKPREPAAPPKTAEARGTASKAPSTKPGTKQVTRSTPPPARASDTSANSTAEKPAQVKKSASARLRRQTEKKKPPSYPSRSPAPSPQSDENQGIAKSRSNPADASERTSERARTATSAAAVTRSASPTRPANRKPEEQKSAAKPATRASAPSSTPARTPTRASKTPTTASKARAGAAGTATAATAAKAASRSSNETSAKGTKPQTSSATTTKTASETGNTTNPETSSGRTGVAPTASAAGTSKGTKSDDAKRIHKGLEWEYCGPRPAKLGPAAVTPQPSEEDPLYVGADTFDYDQELELLTMTGNVEMIQGSRYVGADKVTYDRGSTDLLANGNTILANPGIRIAADEAEMNLESDKGNLTDVEYRLSGKINARGSADRAELVQPELTRYENIVYTSCRPGQNDWTLDAKELELDQSTGRGVARNAKLRVRGVPVLYTPYMSFPIDDRRKSGILIPSVGQSEDNGIDITVPYYWNIAPNMDATFFPRLMSERGAMLGTEFRFLTERQSGELYGEILPNDEKFEGNQTRWAYKIDHSGRWSPRWSSAIAYNAVSDDEYLEDFGENLELTSTRNIERRGDLAYNAGRWALFARLQDFQTVDSSIAPINRPYGRLPQLSLTTLPLRFDSGLQLGVDADYNYFEQPATVHGNRATLHPYAAWPLRKSYGRLTPTLNLFLAAYGLQNQDAGKSDSPSYAIPSFNLDGELIFERTARWFGQESLQTLEPRIYYLYTPFKDQDDIPAFDSIELNFDYYSLFRPNRFTGRDRIGDANQLTLGLTSRTLEMDSGRELLRASVGQILYFRDRDVQISGPPEDERSSPVAGELSARLLQDWTARATFEWDPNQENDRSRKRALELHYQTREDRLINLAYRFDLGTSEATRYENTDLSFRMPVNPQLQFVGRWYYSLLNSQTVEAFAGVEYGRCCWRVRLLGQHLKNRPDSAGSNTFMVQVELAGLGSIGQQVDKFLERGIYGYQAD